MGKRLKTQEEIDASLGKPVSVVTSALTRTSRVWLTLYPGATLPDCFLLARDYAVAVVHRRQQASSQRRQTAGQAAFATSHPGGHWLPHVTCAWRELQSAFLCRGQPAAEQR